MIGVVDYGVGNVTAFINIYEILNIPATRVTTPSDLVSVDKIILPGVGAFDYAMQRLNDSGLREALEYSVLVKKTPLLGVCVGMQMLADGSDEGMLPGLGFISGRVRSLKTSIKDLKLPLPHMGWNQLEIIDHSSFFIDITEPSYLSFYFLHSYFFDPTDSTVVKCTARYGIDIPALISFENIYGMQCHPEKSHNSGKFFLKSFAEIE